MQAYKRMATIEASSRLVLTDLPFRPGERVEVLVVSDEEERAAERQALCDLLQRTREAPAVTAVTEDEIRAEIQAVRDAA